MQENILKDYLNKRRVSDAVIEQFNIHSDSTGRIVIPVNDENGVHSFNKYRRNPLSDIGPKYTYDKGSKASLYAIDRITNNTKTLFILEGELDTLVAWSCNIPAVSSTGGALSFFPEWAKYFTDKEVIICFDNDSAGGEGMVKAFNIIPHAKILFIPDRPGVKDITDYVSNGGDLHELIKTAKRFTSYQDILDDRAQRLSVWQSTHFHDAYIAKEDEKRRNESTIKETRRENAEYADEVSKAKAYPLTELIKFTQGKARCIYHNEKSASLCYYKDSNRAYCFGCGKLADSIDVYRKLYNCSFKEAIKQLNK